MADPLPITADRLSRQENMDQFLTNIDVKRMRRDDLYSARNNSKQRQPLGILSINQEQASQDQSITADKSKKDDNKENIVFKQHSQLGLCLPLVNQRTLCIFNDGNREVKSIKQVAVDRSMAIDVKEVTRINQPLKYISPPVIDDKENCPIEESPMTISPISHEQANLRFKQRDNKTLHSTENSGTETYAKDIHLYLRQAENYHRPRSDYMDKQTDINGTMRSILVDWLVEVSEEYKLRERTLYLAISYIDRFLSAMKFQEIYPPECAEFAFITDDTYTARQVLKMESLILKVLSFNLSSPTIFDFLDSYSQAAGLQNEIHALSMYLAELTLKDYLFLQYAPSVIAVSAVSLSLHTFNLAHWTSELSDCTSYSWTQVSACVNHMYQAFQIAHMQPQRAIVDKYKSSKYHKVSLLRPPFSAPVVE